MARECERLLQLWRGGNEEKINESIECWLRLRTAVIWNLCSTTSAVLVVNRATTDRVVSRLNRLVPWYTGYRWGPLAVPARAERRGEDEEKLEPLVAEINKGTTKPFNYRGPEINSNGTTVFRGSYGSGSLIGRVIQSGAFQTEQLSGPISLPNGPRLSVSLTPGEFIGHGMIVRFVTGVFQFAQVTLAKWPIRRSDIGNVWSFVASKLERKWLCED